MNPNIEEVLKYSRDMSTNHRNPECPGERETMRSEPLKFPKGQHYLKMRRCRGAAVDLSQ